MDAPAALVHSDNLTIVALTFVVVLFAGAIVALFRAYNAARDAHLAMLPDKIRSDTETAAALRDNTKATEAMGVAVQTMSRAIERQRP